MGNSFKTGAIALLTTAYLSACGGGGAANRSDPEHGGQSQAGGASAASSAPATPQGDEDGFEREAALAVPTSPAGTSTTYRIEKLKTCALGETTELGYPLLGCLAGRIDGRVVRDVMRPNGLPAVMESGERCTAIIRSNGTATLRMQGSEYTHYLFGGGAYLPPPSARYEHQRSAQGEWLQLSSDRSQEDGTRVDGFVLETGFTQGVPGWRLAASFMTPYGHVSCHVELPDPPENAQSPWLTQAQVAACPDSLPTLSMPALSCLTGRYKGIAVDSGGLELAPRQTCEAGLTAGGLFWTKVAGVLSQSALTTSNEGGFYDGLVSTLGSSEDTSQVQTLFLRSGYWSIRSQSGVFGSIKRPHDGSAITLSTGIGGIGYVTVRPEILYCRGTLNR